MPRPSSGRLSTMVMARGRGAARASERGDGAGEAAADDGDMGSGIAGHGTDAFWLSDGGRHGGGLRRRWRDAARGAGRHVRRPGQAQVLAQCAAGVLAPEQAAPAQFRQHQFDEIVQATGQPGRHDVEAVRAFFLEPLLQLVGDARGRAHHLLMAARAGDLQIQLADGQAVAAGQIGQQQLAAAAAVGLGQLGQRSVHRMARQVDADHVRQQLHADHGWIRSCRRANFSSASAWLWPTTGKMPGMTLMESGSRP